MFIDGYDKVENNKMLEKRHKIRIRNRLEWDLEDQDLKFVRRDLELVESLKYYREGYGNIGFYIYMMLWNRFYSFRRSLKGMKNEK